MEKTCSVENLFSAFHDAQIVSLSSSHLSASLLSLNSTSPSINPQCVNYLYRIIVNGLIEVFERLHFGATNNSFNFTTIRIYKILVRFLKEQYDECVFSSQSKTLQVSFQSQCPSSLSTIAANAINEKNLKNSFLQQPKYFNYYASIRKEILDFFLRLRCDKLGKLILVNKQNPKRVFKSKYLHLIIRLLYYY